jgi:hypothetical protein
VETANYYTAFVQPLEQREGRESAKTYLPFPVMYPEFGDRDEEGPGRRDRCSSITFQIWMVFWVQALSFACLSRFVEEMQKVKSC